MPDNVEVVINGRAISVKPGTTVAAAMMIVGAFQKSISGEQRAPVCGMGICFECRATVDGVPHVKTCQLMCRPGMKVDVR